LASWLSGDSDKRLDIECKEGGDREDKVSILGARGFDRGGPTELQAEVPLTSQNKWQKINENDLVPIAA